jgi:hypothetical protein
VIDLFASFSVLLLCDFAALREPDSLPLSASLSTNEVPAKPQSRKEEEEKQKT